MVEQSKVFQEEEESKEQKKTGKVKITISIDRGLLETIDSTINPPTISNRSQAIEYYLRKGLREEMLESAVILISGDHQKISTHQHSGKTLIEHQIGFFAGNGIKQIYILTQNTSQTEKLREEIDKISKKLKVNIRLILNFSEGNAEALASIKKLVNNNFIAISGDILAEFDLQEMAKKHLNSNKPATIGLMTVPQPHKYGNATLSGDLIIDFVEKPKQAKSYAVNSGVYIFSPEIFKYLEGSLEKNVFPKLAKNKQLVGFFTHGKYKHFGKL